MVLPDQDDDRRLANLEGGINFRDIGGYPTQDGRTVAWGRVFRSGSLADLTAADHQYLAALNIRFVCDFRSNRERTQHPTQWPSDRHPEVWWRNTEGSVGDLVKALGQADANAARTRQMMLDMYQTLPFEMATAYSEMFCRLARGDHPLLVHCSAGKDRTGVAAAILLEALGVPRHTVISDYLLTERSFEASLGLLRRDPAGKVFETLERATWEPLFRAERAYIEATFAHLDKHFGGVGRYLSEVLQVSQKMIGSLQAALLVPATGS